MLFNPPDDWIAKLYQQLSKFLQPIHKDYGSYVLSSSFPPFLGRVMPSLAPGNAIRWVLRRLIHSGHLTEVDADVIMTNDIYSADDSQQPFDVLDMKEKQRRRRANATSERGRGRNERVRKTASREGGTKRRATVHIVVEPS